ncbi:MAG: alpha/beta hydrolase [Chitinophagaceae bacterium]|nr:alpha/beta hydrolase [Chitinophagaceae bacterium]
MMKMTKGSILQLLILSVIFFAQISCTKDPVVTGGGPDTTHLTERIIMDTAYGTDPKQKLDIYLPANRDHTTKLLIMIHGGAWNAGDKSEGAYTQAIQLFRQKWPEIAVANINYRLANITNTHYNEIMNDISAAVNFMVSNKNYFKISDTLVMMGASAGAHLAMLYAYKYNTGSHVKSVADFFGPSVLSDWEWYNSYNIWMGVAIKDLLINFNGEPWNKPLYDSNSPYWVATAQSAPTIIFHGSLDVIVPLYQSQWLHSRLNTLGVANEYHEYVDGHGFNSTNMADAITKSVIFFKQHL